MAGIEQLEIHSKVRCFAGLCLRAFPPLDSGCKFNSRVVSLIFLSCARRFAMSRQLLTWRALPLVSLGVHCAMGQGRRRSHHIMERSATQEVNVRPSLYSLRIITLFLCERANILWPEISPSLNIPGQALRASPPTLTTSAAASSSTRVVLPTLSLASLPRKMSAPHRTS